MKSSVFSVIDCSLPMYTNRVKQVFYSHNFYKIDWLKYVKIFIVLPLKTIETFRGPVVTGLKWGYNLFLLKKMFDRCCYDFELGSILVNYNLDSMSITLKIEQHEQGVAEGCLSAWLVCKQEIDWSICPRCRWPYSSTNVVSILTKYINV